MLIDISQFNEKRLSNELYFLSYLARFRDVMREPCRDNTKVVACLMIASVSSKVSPISDRFSAASPCFSSLYAVVFPLPLKELVVSQPVRA